MKIQLFLAGLLFTTGVLAETFTAKDDVIACVRKPRGGYATSWALVMLKKTQGVVVYQNSSRGNESDPITSIGQVGSKLIVQHNAGTSETVVFDLKNSTASWSEDAYPANTELYRVCKGFAKFDFDTVQAWFKSVVVTEDWANRQQNY